MLDFARARVSWLHLEQHAGLFQRCDSIATTLRFVDRGDQRGNLSGLAARICKEALEPRWPLIVRNLSKCLDDLLVLTQVEMSSSRSFNLGELLFAERPLRQELRGQRMAALLRGGSSRSRSAAQGDKGRIRIGRGATSGW